MDSTDQLGSPTRRRGPSWAALALALLSIAVLLFWAFVFVDSLRHSTGWELGRPLLFLVGAVLVRVGVAGSGAAARLAWAWPSRSTAMILAAALGLAATCAGGLLMLRSFEFHVMPRIVETMPEDESSLGSRDAVAGLAGGMAGAADGNTAL